MAASTTTSYYVPFSAEPIAAQPMGNGAHRVNETTFGSERVVRFEDEDQGNRNRFMSVDEFRAVPRFPCEQTDRGVLPSRRAILCTYVAVAYQHFNY